MLKVVTADWADWAAVCCLLDMQACMQYIACIMRKRIQYTIRNVPENVDDALRNLAVREGCSLNAVALAALESEAGVSGGKAAVYHDLDDLVGSWVHDDAFDKALAAFDVVDEDLWK